MKKVAFISFGCKVNRAETDAMIAQLAAYGAEYTADTALADIIIVNTCAVTEKAQKEGEKYLHALKKNSLSLRPRGCLIVATGCTAELYKSTPEKLGADIVIPNSTKDQTLKIIFNDPGYASVQSTAPLPTTGTRAFLKIQDGCNAFCTYCIIPTLRGKPISRDENEIVDTFGRFLKEGYKEIVLTGIHIGLYGIENHGTTLPDLLNRLTALEGEFRIRLTSLYVNEITDALIQAVLKAGNKIAPHFHISLQSGSTEILRRMGRKYKPEEASEVITSLRKKIEGVTIGADIITGFPGETEELFQETIDFLESTPLDFLHVFPYSVRPGTPAEKFENQLPAAVKQARAKTLRHLGAAQLTASAEKLIGQTLIVLAEKDNKGHSAGYHLVHLPEDTPANVFTDVLVTEILTDGSLRGKSVK